MKKGNHKMIKTVTSITLFNDAVGKRISISYSEIDETTGQVISDNKRVDRVVTDRTAKADIEKVEDYAQEFIDAVE
jgi:hypothetical protein